MTKMQQLSILVFLTVIGFIAFLTLLTLERAGQNAPELIGYNCEGAAGPLFANNESDFPTCERIERIKK